MCTTRRWYLSRSTGRFWRGRGQPARRFARALPGGGGRGAAVRRAGGGFACGLAELQTLLDEWARQNGAAIDYIHGADVARRLAAEGAASLLLPVIPKEELFVQVRLHGALPRQGVFHGRGARQALLSGMQENPAMTKITLRKTRETRVRSGASLAVRLGIERVEGESAAGVAEVYSARARSWPARCTTPPRRSPCASSPRTTSPSTRISSRGACARPGSTASAFAT